MKKMKKCNFCGNKNFSAKTTDYIYRHKGQFMLFRHVPCEVCDYCGEAYYEAKVLKTIEKEFFDVQEHKKEPAEKILMPVEEFAAVS